MANFQPVLNAPPPVERAVEGPNVAGAVADFLSGATQTLSRVAQKREQDRLKQSVAGYINEASAETLASEQYVPQYAPQFEQMAQLEGRSVDSVRKDYGLAALDQLLEQRGASALTMVRLRRAEVAKRVLEEEGVEGLQAFASAGTNLFEFENAAIDAALKDKAATMQTAEQQAAEAQAAFDNQNATVVPIVNTEFGTDFKTATEIRQWASGDPVRQKAVDQMFAYEMAKTASIAGGGAKFLVAEEFKRNPQEFVGGAGQNLDALVREFNALPPEQQKDPNTRLAYKQRIQNVIQTTQATASDLGNYGSNKMPQSQIEGVLSPLQSLAVLATNAIDGQQASKDAYEEEKIARDLAVVRAENAIIRRDPGLAVLAGDFARNLPAMSSTEAASRLSAITSSLGVGYRDVRELSEVQTFMGDSLQIDYNKIPQERRTATKTEQSKVFLSHVDNVMQTPNVPLKDLTASMRMMDQAFEQFKDLPGYSTSMATKLQTSVAPIMNANATALKEGFPNGVMVVEGTSLVIKDRATGAVLFTPDYMSFYASNYAKATGTEPTLVFARIADNFNGGQ